jgi:flavin reductase (DIM6/NTAB) family NADH-FMN oxidoreductase RutF
LKKKDLFWNMNQSYLEIIPGEIKTADLHSFLLGAVSPRPIAFASTIDSRGRKNLAPFSFFNVFSANPPVLIFSPARRVRDNTTKDTLQNVLEVPEVCIQVVTKELLMQMNLASNEFPSDVDEFIKAGLTSLPSDLIRPFRVAESPIQMECKVFEIKPLSPKAGAGNLIFCELLKMHIHPSVLNEAGKIDPAKLNPVARLGGDWYCEVNATNLMEVEKPSRIPGIGIDQLPESIRNSDLLRGNELGMLGNTEKIPDKEEALPRLTQVAEWRSIHTEPELHAEIRNLLHSGNKPDALILAFYGHRLLS